MIQNTFSESVNEKINQICQTSPLIPVITIKALKDAVPLATALFEGGIHVLEITLRTPCAVEAIEVVRQALPEAIVGAGSVINAEQLKAVNHLGVDFVVTPGLTPKLLAAALEYQLPLLPGVATLSEIMQGLEAGLKQFKFFPAASSGGVKALQAFHGPLPHIRFCPTGGVNLENAHSYLSLPNVLCVGGSWVMPSALIEQKDWSGIKQLTQETLSQLTQRQNAAVLGR